MPTVNDIMEVAGLFESKAVVAIEDHCVAVRNRNATCRKCADACIAGAIEIGSNEIKINALACVACGVCIAACPTAALVGLDPMDEDLAADIAGAVKQAQGSAVVACARAAAKDAGDPDKYATVPCLGRIEETMLVALAARGIEDIVLVDGTCSTCKYGKASSYVDATVDTASCLLEMRGNGAVIARQSEFPPEIRVADARKAVGAARRGFLTSAGGYAKNVAYSAAEKAINDRLQQSKQKKVRTLRDRLKAGKNGKMPPFAAERNMTLLNDLFEMGDIAEERISTRLFGAMDIDAAKCSGCGMCVMFCPTEAVKYAQLDEPADESMRYLEFQAADCTQCNLCVDVCLRHCITLDSAVQVEELFDFEPRFIEIPQPSKKTGFLERRHGGAAGSKKQ